MPPSNEKISSIFRYLKDYNNKRNPIKRSVRDYDWYLKIDDLPEHPSCKVGVFRESGSEITGDDFILKVRRPVLTKPPKPPETIIEWLKRGWETPDGKAEINQSRNVIDADGRTIIENFHDEASRLDAFASWEKQWREWAQNERPALAAARTFEKLFVLHSTIEREAEKVEVVIGEGVISLSTPNGIFHHPVLLQRLQLEFDPETPEFTIRETDHPLELYSALFLELPDIPGNFISQYRSRLEQLPIHPCGGATTTGFLKALVQSLASDAEFVETGEPRTGPDHIKLGRAPYIFVRNRALGFASAIDSILESIPEQESFPAALLNIVGDESIPPDADESSSEADLSGGGNEDTEILFCKPANPEQLKIARRIEKYGCVLVHGPPGTGKTHTIANLVGHLLAQGKRILITSHTTKALRVLREKVEEGLRPLCVSVLARDTDSRKQLESSIMAIDEKLTSIDPRDLDRKAGRLREQRNIILDDLKRARNDLMLARNDEYRDVVIAGQAFSPSGAARQVSKGKGENDWLPGPLAEGAPLPLGLEEINELYKSNEIVEEYGDGDFQDPTFHDERIRKLLAPDDFERLVDEYRRLSSGNLQNGESYWVDCSQKIVSCSCGASNRLRKNWLGFALRCTSCDNELTVDSGQGYDYKPLSGDSLGGLLRRVGKCIDPICAEDAPEWSLVIVQDGMGETETKNTWTTLLGQIEEARKLAAESKELFIKYDPKMEIRGDASEALETLSEIEQRYKKGKSIGKLNPLRKKWRQLVGGCEVNGAPPNKLEHFKALLAYAKLMESRQSLRARWSRMVSSIKGPEIEANRKDVENFCFYYAPSISKWLNWHQTEWAPLENELLSAGFKLEELVEAEPPFMSDYGTIARLLNALKKLPEIVESRQKRLKLETIAIQFRKLDKVASQLSQKGSSDVWRALNKAVSAKDTARYRRAMERVNIIRSVAIRYQRRLELLGRLEQTAPSWAALIRVREKPHDKSVVPGDPGKAWIWRQQEEELQRRASKSIPEIQNKIESFSNDLQRVTGDLIYNMAWGNQLKKLSRQLELSQALKSWLFIVRQIGAGTGKKVPVLSRQAKKLMVKSQDAVPVWVMPLSRVVENFDPSKTHFDVVIIDEASQCDPLGLVSFYMADKVVVVGDHEQVSPSVVGVTDSVALGLINLHLSNFANNLLYLPTGSLYELARASFGSTIQLTEHFRCVPDIIQFSNNLSYNGTIKPLRDVSTSSLLPHTVAYRVEGAVSENKVNKTEALTTASLMAAAMEQPEYEGKDFGAISLIGEEQAFRIEKILREHLPPSEIESRRLMCGSPPQFQGDERNVIFLSMVDTPSGEGPLSLRQAGANDMYKKRYNVAASRAKDQMWLVYSLNQAIDLQQGDIRRRLIEHMMNPNAITNIIEQSASETESEFERQVFERIVSKGYKVILQKRVGKYRIDLVVVSNGKQLAVECDGDRYHNLDNLPEDMARQAILERLGWTFVRIRGSEFFRNPDLAMRPVFDKINKMGLQPEATESLDDVPQTELKERIITRAAEIRREWKEGGYTFKEPGLARSGDISVEDLEYPPEDAKSAPDLEKELKDHKIDICMHHNTGKWYLCVDGTDDGARLTVVTPEGRLLNMDSDLFDDPVEDGINKLLLDQRITPAQLSVYHEYLSRQT